jgi:hypothetical protein
MSGNLTPKPIHPKEKYVIQGYFLETSQNPHDCLEKRIPSSEELLGVAKQDEIKENQRWCISGMQGFRYVIFAKKAKRNRAVCWRVLSAWTIDF